jgi:hypothetical protein
MQIYQLDARTRGVVGCGRRLTYVEVCDRRHRRPSCSWMLDSPAWSAPVMVASPRAPSYPPAPASASASPPPPPAAGQPEEAAHEEGEAPLPAPEPSEGSPPSTRPPIRDFGF